MSNSIPPRSSSTTQSSGSEISFDRNKVYNTFDSPSAAAALTNDLTNARLGVVQKIYHEAASEPTYPSGWVQLGTATYSDSTLNIIYCEWVSGTRVEYWYSQETV